MQYNFDEIIPRKGTNSLKYDFAVERGKPEDILPLWVADMDFQIPAEVRQTLVESAQHGIFGYSEVKADYVKAVTSWFRDNFDFNPDREWLVKTPGIVYALAMAVRAFSEKGDAVLIQQPVYYPFSAVVLSNERKLINNELIYKDGQYHIDLIDFEQKIAEHQVKIFILCSPHNPVGRVWTVEELTAMGEICAKHKCLVISDEIHCDFTYPGYQHRVFASLSDEFAANSIICTAPSKTFNLAGLQVSNLFIANPDLKRKLQKEIEKSGFSQLNTMGLIACQSAYQYGGEWLSQLRTYLLGNLNFARTFLEERLPEIKLIEPQGTYLIWLDCRALGLSHQALNDLIVNKAKLWLDDGKIFGACGDGFQRINIGCPRAILEQALTRLESAIHHKA